MADIHEAVFRSQPDEHAFVPTQVTGKIPVELRGTFLRSGPGLQVLGRDEVNFFDGHALISGLSFADGGCVFRSRYVRTPLYLEETAAGRMTRRRLFTNLPRRWANLMSLDLGNNAMHDVFPWNGKVFATADLGHFALDGSTLETLGPEDWGGAHARGWEMCPMPNVDPTTGRAIAWLKKQGKTKPDQLCFVELDEGLRVVHRTRPHSLGKSPTLTHDHRATGRWYVATQAGPTLAVGAALWGKKTIFDSLTWPTGPSLDLLLVSRPTGDRLVRVRLPVQIAFHVINAYDEGDHLVVDLCTYDDRIDFSAAASQALRERLGLTRSASPRPTPRRFVIDPTAARIVDERTLGSHPMEAPEVPDRLMGQRHRYAYAAALVDGDPPDRGSYFHFDGVGKLDCDSGTSTGWSAGKDAVASPPSFAPRPGGEAEDDGWLLSWVLRADGAGVVVLDARNLAPVAEVRLGIGLPGVSHCRWAADLKLAA